MKKENRWVLIRDGEVKGMFENRKEAIKYFKDLLNQTLKDFKNQDKSDEYDYPINIPKTEIKPFDDRPAYLSLL